MHELIAVIVYGRQERLIFALKNPAFKNFKNPTTTVKSATLFGTTAYIRGGGKWGRPQADQCGQEDGGSKIAVFCGNPS